MTMVVGVLVLAIGFPRMFASLEDGDGKIDNSVMVLGYVIMRIALAPKACNPRPKRGFLR